MPEPTGPADRALSADRAVPADRALRALVDTVAESRPRLPGDASDPGIPVAATVVIARDGSDGSGGPEVLMIERPDRGSFAGAWVFPGGKLEPGDARTPDEPEEEVARRAGVRETWEETGLHLGVGDFVTASCWDPPPGIALRIRTWFFAARAPEGDLALSADEAVSAEWVRPSDILDRHAGGELTLYPPTWVTLHSLAGQPDVDTLLAVLRLRGVEHFETVARRTPSGPVLLWQGDADYDEGLAGEGREAVEPAGEDPPSSRHRLDVTALPWRYTRSR